MAALAFSLYAATLAPGLTWANFGADGGELLAAAVVKGIPHPPGYPLYMLLLQGWLWLLEGIGLGGDLAWRGNLFSAVWAGISVGFTCLVAAHLGRRLLFPHQPRSALLFAITGALAWAVAPLLWGQAVITEVYTLHAALVSFLAWVLITRPLPSPVGHGLLLGLGLGLGAAHHFTLLLLGPALLYWLWLDRRHWAGDGSRAVGRLLLGMLLGGAGPLLLYLRLPLAAAGMPPVNWGYPVDWAGFWWTISGEAYRPYLFGIESTQTLDRLSNWARVLVDQFTPIGFGVMMAGLYWLDQRHPHLRTFSLLWALPLTLYTIGYNTVDSQVYLLPVIWLIALWMPLGILSIGRWLARWRPQWSRHLSPARLLMAGCLGLVLLTLGRLPTQSLHQDEEARLFLAGLAEHLEPGSLILSSGDAETFTLWYGFYASGELAEVAPDAVLLNVALFQFDWYRRLVKDLYPDLPGIREQAPAQLTVLSILQQNQENRPIFFTEIVNPARPDQLRPVGPIWRYQVDTDP
jgi:hypothetical protein